ncbi:MAG: right-handed parallel beta-helix repeat-containing protein [Myxococcota bacterium]
MIRQRIRLAARGSLQAALFIGVLMSCGTSTRVDVVLEAQPCVAAVASRIEVEVFDESGAVLGSVEGPATFPTGVRLASDSGTPWRLEARLFDGNDVPVATLRDRGNFEIDSRSLTFEDRCLGVRCAEGYTCAAGECALASSSGEASAALDACPAWTFVSTTGTSAEDCGTFDAPCSGLSSALNALGGSAAVISYLSGEYTASRLIEPERGPLLIRAAFPDTPPTLRATGDTAITIQANDVTLQDLILTGGGTHGASFNLGRARLQERLRVRGCVFEGNGSEPAPAFDNKAGLMFNNEVRDFVVEDSIFRNNSGPGEFAVFGAYINRASAGVVRRCRFESNRGAGVFLSVTENIRVEDTTFVDNPDGVWAAFESSVEITRGRFCGAERAFVVSTDGTAVAERSSFADNVRAVRYQPQSTGSLRLENNLFAHSDDVAVEVDGSRGPSLGENLFFANAENTRGFAPDTEPTERDPQLEGREDCSLVAGDAMGFGAP